MFSSWWHVTSRSCPQAAAGKPGVPAGCQHWLFLALAGAWAGSLGYKSYTSLSTKQTAANHLPNSSQPHSANMGNDKSYVDQVMYAV